MAGRNKLQKFSEILAFPNVYENFDNAELTLTGANGAILDMKGNWNSTHFKNNNPITLELACGRGEYALALGRMFPERNFVGVDIKGARIHQGARVAIEENLTNVAFLRTRIEFIEHFFAKDEVADIWITFPDPFLRESKSNRRLTSSIFLNKYKQFLQKEGLVHLKTDSPVLYDFTLEVLQDTEGSVLEIADADFYATPLIMKELEVKTHYEKKNIANSTMKYIRFKL
jgi:tRNA (guanine-N7-)-methyltransferase